MAVQLGLTAPILNYLTSYRWNSPNHTAPPLHISVPSPTLIFTSLGRSWWNRKTWIDISGDRLFLLRHQKHTKIALVALSTFNGCYLPKELSNNLSALIIVSHVSKMFIWDSLMNRFTGWLYFAHINEHAQLPKTESTVKELNCSKHVSNSSAHFVVKHIISLFKLIHKWTLDTLRY